MNLLICAATSQEVAPFYQFLQKNRVGNTPNGYNYYGHTIYLLITGVGGVATAYHLTKFIQNKNFDLIIQAGIAGTFSANIDKGFVCQVKEEYFADLGAEDDTAFLDVFDLKLLNKNSPPFTDKKITAPKLPLSVLSLLPKKSAVSVNTVSGNKDTILKLKEKYQPALESMEGAAFFYVCKCEKIPFIQIRSISNDVEVRDVSHWEIGLAIKTLNETLIRFFEEDLKK